MLEPDHVANCLNEMQNAVDIPVTIKCRLGVDDNDTYEFFESFVNKVKQAGIKNFIVHVKTLKSTYNVVLCNKICDRVVKVQIN